MSFALWRNPRNNGDIIIQLIGEMEPINIYREVVLQITMGEQLVFAPKNTEFLNPQERNLVEKKAGEMVRLNSPIVKRMKKTPSRLW